MKGTARIIAIVMAALFVFSIIAAIIAIIVR